MGADFTYAICRIPYDEAGEVFYSGNIVKNVMKQRFLKSFREEEQFWGTLEDCGYFYEEENIEEVAEEIADFFDKGWGLRDTATLTLDEKHYFITGGLSWGDEPTDSYKIIALIDALGITDKAITKGELA